MTRRLGRLAVLLVFACSAALAADRQLQIQPAQPAPSGERRIALVIGNSAYKSSPLKNPVNDARAISKALAATGFKVTVLEDASLTTMRRAVRAFGDELMAGGVGLFYYAGHGMQVRGRNYLIPVNADIEREDEVEDGALDANFVLAKMDSAKNALNLIILDACRNNPFARSFRSGTQGLAQMDAPSGTLVAFATAPGSVASDGDGANGLYTKHLLRNITKAGLPIEQVFKEVRRGVAADTAERQIPWESSSLRGDFFFVAPDPSQSAEAQKARVQEAVADALKREHEKLAAERAAQQAEMQKMIQELLAKQRAELFEQMRRQGVTVPVAAAPAVASTPAPVAAPAPAPAPAPATQLASVVPPTPVAAGNPRLPREGDRWEYRYTDVLTRRTRQLAYEILGASGEGILERAEEGTATLRRAHGSGTDLYFTNRGELWHFSPYLLAFEDIPSARDFGKLVPTGDVQCATLISCGYRGRVEGRERVVTQAGTFDDSVKVVIEFLGHSGRGGQPPEVKQATFWYSAAAKRLVKASLRTLSGGNVFGGAPDYDLELVSYKLN